ncbi:MULTISPECIES: class II aldolase/adducin family protein [Pandoraea]|uniref:class II aldolase/adducin family protein n=1 Tax=Pandoraea TaxID=93217 RepID=UPI001F5D5139|nr:MULTISPECIES: class II aldolase/adducin family protein [Pandoraea]MCI3206224.1 class II aldolase [Pandoraea sp. LA3]MDN4584252.1 class II aldolase [Pandoraea capi]
MKQATFDAAVAPGADPLSALSALDRAVRVAARTLARAGLAHAYGHCSARLDADRFVVCAARPMGLLGVGETGTVVPIDGPLPDGVLGEVRLHQHIYRSRPEIGAVARTMPPKTMSLSTLRRTPRALHGPGTYFAPGVPLWDDPQLIRSDEQAAAVIDTMGTNAAVVMRGNGAVVAADTLEAMVALTWYLEDAARVDLDVLALEATLPAAVLSGDECQARATRSGRIIERMWEYLSAGDPELPAAVASQPGS